LDIETIAGILEETRAAVTVEDHNVIGGLGSAVSEVIAEHSPAALVRIGLQDVFPESGEAEQLLDHFGMATKDIVTAVKKVMQKKQDPERP
jgi:transketolase